MSARAAAAALALALLLLPLAPGVALAHDGHPHPGPSIPRVLALTPDVPGLVVAVVEAGARLRLDNGTDAAVGIRSRADVVTIAPGEVFRWTEDAVSVAATSEGPGRWTVPLTVRGQAVTVSGDTVRPSPPPAVLWWAAAVVAAVATARVGARAPRRPGALRGTGAVALAVVAAYLLHLVGSAAVVESAGVAARAATAAGPVGSAAVAAGVVGGVLAVSGVRVGALLAALSGGLLVLATGADVSAFGYAVLPFAWAPDLDRAATVLTVGAGAGLFLAGFGVVGALTAGRDREPRAAGPR